MIVHAPLQPYVCRCRRLYQIGNRHEVLQSIEPPGLQIYAATWIRSGGAQRFLSRCSAAGNGHASYALGMVSAIMIMKNDTKDTRFYSPSILKIRATHSC